MNYYDIALICLKGHVINSESKSNPVHNTKYCEICGSPTINACPNCGLEIRGLYQMDNVVWSEYEIPSCCHNCGKSYPWTEDKIKMISETLKMTEFSSYDIKGVESNVLDIVSATSTSQLSAYKFNRFGSKLSGAALSLWDKVLKPAVVEISSETLKKIITGQ